jgi:predicted TIM-barrel fold metal-dependent hydrolase
MSVFDEAKVDCHCHVFDPARFPYTPGNFYLPAGQERGTPAQFTQLIDAYGVRHAVLVGPNSGYGLDNRCLLDTIAQSAGRLKGVAVVRNDASLDELAELKAAGIIGVAFNPALVGVAEYANAGGLLAHLAELDLFAQVQVEGDQLVEFAPMLLASGAKLIFDHCGRPNPQMGVKQPGFQALLELGRSGRAAVKLSGYVKYSKTLSPHADVHAYLAELIAAFTLDACVWGSDWPFLRAEPRIDYGVLLQMIVKLLPEPGDRRKLFWESPCALFGFDPAAA